MKLFSVGINWAFKKKYTPPHPPPIEAHVGIRVLWRSTVSTERGFWHSPPLSPRLQPLHDIVQFTAQDPLQHQLLNFTPGYEVSLSSFTDISSSSCFQRMEGRGINSAPEDRHSCSRPAEFGIPELWRCGTDLSRSVIWDVHAHPHVTFFFSFFLKSTRLCSTCIDNKFQSLKVFQKMTFLCSSQLYSILVNTVFW